jgi:hypothetical protein
MVGRGASGCQRNAPRKRAQPGHGRPQAAGSARRLREDAGRLAQVPIACELASWRFVLCAPPESCDISQLRLRAGPCRCQRKRPRGSTPGPAPAARSPRDACSSAGHGPRRNLATGGRANPPLWAASGSLALVGTGAQIRSIVRATILRRRAQHLLQVAEKRASRAIQTAAARAAWLGRTGRPGFAVGHRRAAGGCQPFPPSRIFRVGTFRFERGWVAVMQPHAPAGLTPR